MQLSWNLIRLLGHDTKLKKYEYRFNLMWIIYVLQQSIGKIQAPTKSYSRGQKQKFKFDTLSSYLSRKGANWCRHKYVDCSIMTRYDKTEGDLPNAPTVDYDIHNIKIRPWYFQNKGFTRWYQAYSSITNIKTFRN